MLIHNDIGYQFEVTNFRELTPQERIKYNIPKNLITYLVNEKKGSEIIISLDGFYYQGDDDLPRFYEVCRDNMVAHGYEVVSETIFESWVGLKKKAYKLLAYRPNGTLQVTYFTILTDMKLEGRGFGCIMAEVQQDHGPEENSIIEIINNWQYC